MRKELPHPGHFVAVRDCQFRRHTHTRDYCISTVGEYVSPQNSGKFLEIGHGRLYETLVFRLDPCCCPNCPGGRGDEIASGGYNEAAAANAGHEYMVRKFLKLERCTRSSRGRVIGQLPREEAGVARARPSVSSTGLDAFFGKWPGDETDEQLAEALKDR